MTTTPTSVPPFPADELLRDIELQSEDLLRDVAQLLHDTPDEKLFGDTEFLVRDKVLRIVARAYQVRLDQKKTAMKAPESIAPTATE